MIVDKPRAPGIKPQAGGGRGMAPAGPTLSPPKPPPMFRPADWLCFGVTTLVMCSFK